MGSLDSVLCQWRLPYQNFQESRRYIIDYQFSIWGHSQYMDTTAYDMPALPVGFSNVPIIDATYESNELQVILRLVQSKNLGNTTRLRLANHWNVQKNLANQAIKKRDEKIHRNAMKSIQNHVESIKQRGGIVPPYSIKVHPILGILLSKPIKSSLSQQPMQIRARWLFITNVQQKYH